jgi:hypothetical protein
MADIAHFFQSVKLPVMPEVAQALIRTLNNPDADVTSVTHVIAKDPALTVSLLRIANSALFGLSRSVSSLDSAVSVVGMSICIANAFRFPPHLSRLEFWRRSMVCAGYAKWLAGTIGLDEQQAWLTGMMLRLGELVIAQRNPDLLKAIERQPCDPGERWTRERSLAGFDECQFATPGCSRVFPTGCGGASGRTAIENHISNTPNTGRASRCRSAGSGAQSGKTENTHAAR